MCNQNQCEKEFQSIKIYYEITKPFSTKQPPDDTLAPTLTPPTLH